MLCVLTICVKAQPGALDLSFNPGSGADSTVWSCVVKPNGKIIIGGDFFWFNGIRAGRMTWLNADGSVDTTMYRGPVANSGIRHIQLRPDGKIYIAGLFRLLYGVDYYRNKLALLNDDGTVDTSYFHNRIGFIAETKAIAQLPDSEVVVVGNFFLLDSVEALQMARLNAQSLRDTNFVVSTDIDGSVECITRQPDGNLLIGGSFTKYDSSICLRVARIKPNGRIDGTFNPVIGGAGANIDAIALQPDGKIILGGQFTFYNGTPEQHIVRTYPNGGIDFSFAQNSGANMPVRAITTLNTGNILVAGDFTAYQGKPVGRIAMINQLGIIDTSFITGSGANGRINSMTLQPDGKILITGNFTTFNGVSRRRIARLYNCLTEKPDSIYGSNYALCSGINQTYSVTPVAGATKYQWTLPNGWTGSSDSASITATSNGTGGTISVKAFTDSCGYSYATSRVISTVVPPTVPICLVTVDTLSTHNIVIWEKPLTTTIDSFFIYRETSTNVYTKIGAVPYDSLSEYHDYSANPNATSYRYKLSVLDTCGAESDKSPYHNTIHLQNLGSGNFQWTFYRIENALNPVLEFNIYRDNLGNSNYTPIGIVPGSNATFTDVTFASADTDALYVLDVNWAISCQPTRQVSTTRSNIRPKGLIDVAVLRLDEVKDAVHIYPNPASETLFVHLPAGITQLQLINSIGQVVRQSKTAPDRAKVVYPLDVSALPSGVYTLVAETANDHLYKKVIVE